MRNTVCNIAVLVSCLNEEYQNRILRGVQQYASEHAVNICHFVGAGGLLGNSVHDVGEFNIYNLVNYQRLDGVILLNNTIPSEEVTTRILAQVKAAGIPAVSVDLDIPSLYSIGIDNYQAMRRMVEHVVEEHGCTRINYVSGPDANPESIERLRAFRDVMAEHSLLVDERRIYHGYFMGQDGRLSVETFLAAARAEEPEQHLDFPEAIICANDVMAVSAMITLDANGLRVPDDVIVTGFDNITAARNFSPELSSVDRPLFESGYQACETLLKHLQHVKCERGILLDTQPVFTESCGCKHDMADSIVQFKKNNYRVLEQYSIGIQCNNRMNCAFAECDSLEDNIRYLKDFVRELQCESFYLCLVEGWMGDVEALCDYTQVDQAEQYLINGYSRQMTVPLAYYNHAFQDYPWFDSELMLPDLYEDSSVGHCYYFFPIHFRNRCLGYLAICNSKVPLDSPTIHSWMITVSNSLENIRKILCMRAVCNELDRLYVIDPLSNIYNRNGFSRATAKRYDDCVARGIPIMVMFADLDGLKYINDHFGHKQGDLALKEVGIALRHACKNGEVYARFGGDEFLIFGANYSEAQGSALIQAIEAEFHAFNSQEDQYFTLAASIGFHITVPDAATSLFSLITIADQKMYEQKKKKKMSKYLRKD